ncbi:MAG: hypothetical protein HS111_15120 [Kofleriaceae bacterium]|nr:hypothetical protein [Kofleriaceae bacterium]
MPHPAHAGAHRVRRPRRHRDRRAAAGPGAAGDRGAGGAGGRAAAYRRVVERVRAGERAFVVCPLVEASTDESRQGWADATSVHARLRAELAPLRVGLVHGKLATPERDQAMGARSRGASSTCWWRPR